MGVKGESMGNKNQLKVSGRLGTASARKEVMLGKESSVKAKASL